MKVCVKRIAVSQLEYTNSPCHERPPLWSMRSSCSSLMAIYSPNIYFSIHVYISVYEYITLNTVECDFHEQYT